MLDNPVRRAAVLGHPIGHSLSPVIHRAAYQILELPWTYDRIDVTTEQLAEWVTSRTAEWVGASLTMPLKSDVLPLLDTVDEVVLATGAANTVIFTPTGRHGFNTDVQGIVSAVAEVGVGPTPSVLIIGAGATARSAVAAAARMGARQVDVLARRPEACDDIVVTAAAVGITPRIFAWTSSEIDLHHDLVISTVPAGVADALVDAVPTRPGVLLDVVYQSWPSPLARSWEANQGRAASGLEMLLYQGVEQIALMTGQRVAADQIRPTLRVAANTAD